MVARGPLRLFPWSRCFKTFIGSRHPTYGFFSKRQPIERKKIKSVELRSLWFAFPVLWLSQNEIVSQNETMFTDFELVTGQWE